MNRRHPAPAVLRADPFTRNAPTATESTAAPRGYGDLPVLGEIRDDVLRDAPALTAAFAALGARALPWWARPAPWCLGVLVAFAATTAAVWWVGLPALGSLALLLLLGGLTLVSLASSSTGGPSET